MDVRVALAAAAAAAVASWLALTVVTIAGRLLHDHRARRGRERAPRSPRDARRLVRQAARHRGESSKWRRIGALRALAAEGHPRARALVRRALSDPDRDVAAAAVRALGERGDAWAVEALLDALRDDRAPRSRVAAQLERLLPGIGPRLVPLLRETDAGVRFWAATLLAGAPGVGLEELLACARDPDADVRAAAVESLGLRDERAALGVVREQLVDEAWFVRVHACRALGRIGSLADAERLARRLRDPWWWVRSAAKDALRSFGPAVAPALVPYLGDEDGFARNGAAEVLQDVGFVDRLPAGAPAERLRERILTAGGPGLRRAAELRADGDAAPEALEEARAG